MEQNPELVPSGNALGFISDDGGNTYNRCHCKPSPPPYHIRVKVYETTNTWNSQFGVTSKLVTSTFGVAKRTANTLSSLIRRVASTTRYDFLIHLSQLRRDVDIYIFLFSDGEMRPFTVLAQHSLPRRSKFISSTISVRPISPCCNF